MAAPEREELLEPVVLVTVFGPFPGQDVNPTEAIADELAGEEHVVCHVLDVSYARAVQQVDELVAMLDPIAVIAFGVASAAGGVRLEEMARNRDGAATPDVDGVVRGAEPIDAGPEALPSRLPLGLIADALAFVGMRIESSDDAGDYVCNHLFRHLVTSEALAGRPVGFIHVPDPARTPEFDDATITIAGRIVIDTVAAVARGDV